MVDKHDQERETDSPQRERTPSDEHAALRQSSTRSARSTLQHAGAAKTLRVLPRGTTRGLKQLEMRDTGGTRGKMSWRLHGDEASHALGADFLLH